MNKIIIGVSCKRIKGNGEVLTVLKKIKGDFKNNMATDSLGVPVAKHRAQSTFLLSDLTTAYNHELTTNLSSKIIGTFCDKCRMPYCICKPQLTTK